MSDKGIRHFEDVPVGSHFADKFGRVHTKTGTGVARAHPASESTPDYFIPLVDTSRDYWELDVETIEDDPMVFDTWPYFVLAELPEVSE